MLRWNSLGKVYSPQGVHKRSSSKASSKTGCSMVHIRFKDKFSSRPNFQTEHNRCDLFARCAQYNRTSRFPCKRLYTSTSTSTSSPFTHPNPLLPHKPPKNLRTQSPSPHRQPLQFHRRRFNISPKSHHSENHTQNINNIISVPLNNTVPTTVNAAMFLGFLHTAERLGDEVSFQGGEDGL